MRLTAQACGSDNCCMDTPAKRERGSGVALVLALAVVVVLVPLLYVLSIGPAAWLVNTGQLNGEEGSPAYRFYSPIIWSANNCQPIDDALGWYYSLWVPEVQINYPTPPPTAASGPTPAPAPSPAGS
jgi:hypothetical protein